MTEESDLLSTYLSSFIAICKGSVSPSSSTMTGAHILLESVKVIYFIEMLRHWRNKYSILILTPMWHKFFFSTDQWNSLKSIHQGRSNRERSVGTFHCALFSIFKGMYYSRRSLVVIGHFRHTSLGWRRKTILTQFARLVCQVPWLSHTWSCTVLWSSSGLPVDPLRPARSERFPGPPDKKEHNQRLSYRSGKNVTGYVLNEI